MRQGFVNFLSFLLFFSLGKSAVAGPWFTGPLLAPSGHTIPNGHTNLELYTFITDIEGIYNSFGKVTHTPGDKNYVESIIFSHGITNKMDVQFVLPYAYNRNQGSSSHRLSDTSAAIGFQLFEQKQSRWRPDFRFTIQEIIPTGRFEKLDFFENGTDSTGLGSYQTALNLNFQLLSQLSADHYLRTRLSLGYVDASKAHISGLSSYGGSDTTDGTIRPGNMASIDLAGELNLTQHWVAVMETFVSKRHGSLFNGYPGVDELGNPAIVGHDMSKQVTFAPALEYNFNANVGIIAGVWFIVNGRETAEFSSSIIALNMYW
ncbi:MAG: hypothetical protein Q8M03_11535 [Legionella sp.]|nr:hypothetical protein [Legionella sp.]